MITGFTLVFCERQAKVFLPTVEDASAPSLVTVARDDAAQSVLALMGRLDYRADLQASLPAGAGDADLTDAALALAVYLHAGTLGLQRLEGEFALAVFDGRQRRLIGMRDPFGAWPLYWTARAGSLAMGTSLRALGAEGGRQPVDLGYLAEFLVRPFIPSEVTCQPTALPGVQRVLPGTLVEVNADGSARQETYWDWSTHIEDVRADRVEDVSARFRELLDGAVRERMRGRRVAAHLSGGMDSSAVTILARRTVAATPARPPIAAISLIHHAAELAGERGYMDLVLDQGGPLEPHFVQGDAAVGFDWFDRPIPAHDEPYVGLWSLAANRLLVDVAESCQVGTILTGVGGDEILSYRPLHIADLLRRGRVIAGLREAGIWADAQGLGIWSVLCKCGVEPLWSSGRLSLAPWIRPEFARQHQLHDRQREFRQRQFARPAESSEMRTRLAMFSGDWARWHLYAPRGMNISHPFLDPRVVRYTLGIPRRVRAAPGDPKPVLRAAMQGLLPDAIRNRREKTGFDGPHARGIARHLVRLEALVRNSRIHDLGVFDTDKLLASMQQAAIGIDSPHNEAMDRTLALIAWFEQRTARS